MLKNGVLRVQPDHRGKVKIGRLPHGNSWFSHNSAVAVKRYTAVLSCTTNKLNAVRVTENLNQDISIHLVIMIFSAFLCLCVLDCWLGKRNNLKKITYYYLKPIGYKN